MLITPVVGAAIASAFASGIRSSEIRPVILEPAWLATVLTVARLTVAVAVIVAVGLMARRVVIAIGPLVGARGIEAGGIETTWLWLVTAHERLNAAVIVAVFIIVVVAEFAIN